MPFGWSLSPFWANQWAKPIKRWLNQKGIHHIWWVDDVMILGETKQETEEKATQFIQLLTSLGMQINLEKSMDSANQTVEYVGQIFNFKENTISMVPLKQMQTIRNCKHQMKSNNVTPKHLAALAGTLMDINKGNAGTQSMPQQLMRCAAQAVK